jgi:hypothetical protein
MSYTAIQWSTERAVDGAGSCAYTDHEQMTHGDVSYILSCADTSNIAKIPIEHINEFINIVEDGIEDIDGIYPSTPDLLPVAYR